MHHKTSSQFPVDYYARKVIKWRWLIYPWAVYEDISGFLRNIKPTIESIEQSQHYLANKFNIKISQKKLSEIFDMMKS